MNDEQKTEDAPLVSKPVAPKPISRSEEKRRKKAKVNAPHWQTLNRVNREF
ncbi:hypothetical protein [Ketogulonicigenium vulgare]|uniref:hypothetical protein n=1 Tax=Ketogulonicigenium vulgare TaxID=92945 RepID=UPI002359325B|nr:hypothetical protein [Ketogulonicigenium vulgare]